MIIVAAFVMAGALIGLGMLIRQQNQYVRSMDKFVKEDWDEFISWLETDEPAPDDPRLDR